MLRDIWNFIKALFGPVIFLVRTLASVWSGFGRIASFVMGFVNSVVAPGLALWKGSRSYISRDADGAIRVSTEHMKTGSDRVYVQDSTMSDQEFQDFDFLNSANESERIFEEVQKVVNEGDTVAVNFSK